MIDWQRDPRFDVPVLSAGTAATAALAYGCAALLAHVNRSDEGLGPTAATLTDFWNVVLGAALGFLVGTGGVAALVRTGSRVASGILCGVLAFVVLVAGFEAVTRTSESLGDTVAFLFYAAVLMAVPTLLGSMAGAFIGALLDGFRRTSGQAGR